ncbi:ATP-binding protein [Acidicapsa dinghuensis]|uniref:ATP-binding protein n=1 Tax=Acidicapsa dinghuensis TaxID=2218256 RepID=A0ABW1EIZ7_9BACT|nr:ATP-binding protein [Acidicapsa dinghuensis]
MVEILLNAAKLAFSEDARKSVSALVDFIRHTPQWQSDICELEAKVDLAHREVAVLLQSLAEAKLQNLNFPPDAVAAFRLTAHELTTNAFENGCENEQAISIALSTSPGFVAVRVENARGYDFDLTRQLEQSRVSLMQNPRSTRGRGLMTVAEAADTLEQAGDRGVKAVIYRERVQFERLNAQNPAIFKLLDGMYNPSLSRRIVALLEPALAKSDVILDLSIFPSSPSVAYTMTLQLDELARSHGHRFVLLLNSGAAITASPFALAGLTVVHDWLEAAEALKSGS